MLTFGLEVVEEATASIPSSPLSQNDFENIDNNGSEEADDEQVLPVDNQVLTSGLEVLEEATASIPPSPLPHTHRRSARIAANATASMPQPPPQVVLRRSLRLALKPRVSYVGMC